MRSKSKSFRRICILLMIGIYIFIGSSHFRSYHLPLKETLTVEVRGEVENPGLFTLKKGAIFQDLLKELKLKETADLSSIALSKELYDGDIFVIAQVKEEKKISINSASMEELVTLPGIGEKTAEKIIVYREVHGGFKALEELQNVAGIKSKIFAKIAPFIEL